MGINEIRDGMDTLLTERLANIRRVERREGEAGGSSREFQQLFEFARKEQNEEGEDKEKRAVQPPPPPLAARTRIPTPEEIEEARKRNELVPGQLIDIEA